MAPPVFGCAEPGAQSVHFVWCVKLVAVPAAHGVHVIVPLAPGGVKRPVGQSRHVIEPGSDWYMASEQGVHVMVPLSEVNVPAKQGVHREALSALEKRPGVHSSQKD
jgi:hypothetical protein